MTGRRRWGGEPDLPRLAVVAAAALVAAATLVIALRSGGSYEVSAVFDDVRGLIEGGEVKAGGVEVGKVERITFTEDGMPQVTLSVDSDFVLRRGAFADIRLASNVGAINRYVDLTQGEGPELEPGAVLGPGRTDQPVDLDLAVSALDPRTRAEVGELLADVDAATRGRGADLAGGLRNGARALGETADLLGAVNADGLALERLVGDGAEVAAALARGSERLGPAAERLALALDLAAARQAELGRAARALGPGLGAARATLEDLSASTPNLRALVRTARPAVAELAPTARVLRPALAALRPLAAEARRVAAPVRRQLRRLRPVIAAALPVARRLPGTLAMLTPLLDHLRARAPEVVGFFTLFGDATSSYDANGNLIRASTVLIQANRHPNEIDAASDEPGSIARPFDRDPGAAEGEPWAEYWETFIGGGRPPRSYLDASETAP